MPRALRAAIGGLVYHVLNRANARMPLFQGAADYEAFERILVAAHEKVPMRTLAYSVMPNHWHMVLWPQESGDLSKFMRWLTLTHTQRWHKAHKTVGCGHLYQGRFKSFPVESDGHLVTVCRYVERNPLRAGLVNRAEEWRWGSLGRLLREGEGHEGALLSAWPISRPADWVNRVNFVEPEADLVAVRHCIARGRPYGNEGWVVEMARGLGIESALRSRGRPRVQP